MEHVAAPSASECRVPFGAEKGSGVDLTARKAPGHTPGAPTNAATDVSTVGGPAADRQIAKRCLDIGLSLIGLTLSSPIWIAVASAIKIDDRGPVFYRQHRYGRGGQPFRLAKFRTMRAAPPEERIQPATAGDARITRVGRVLRAMGLDELPQLWNILVGDMSLVGPRALAVGESLRMADGTVVDFEEVPGFHERLDVKPGLTGLATIYLPKDADPLEKLDYDLRYIQEYSFWLDVRLIALSLWISVRGKWETRDDKL